MLRGRPADESINTGKFEVSTRNTADESINTGKFEVSTRSDC